MGQGRALTMRKIMFGAWGEYDKMKWKTILYKAVKEVKIRYKQREENENERK